MSTKRCQICDKEFQLMSMDLHIATCHNSNQLQMGKRTFQTKNILQIHMKTVHKGGKYYKCEPCGKSFTRGSTLKRHIHTIHEGHKDYKCESCGKSFSHAHHLKTHIQTVHEGHKCESCDKSFSHIHI